MIGLCGAHRTGKTTLAKAYAEKAEMVFLETRSSKVFERLGMSPKTDYDFETRMLIQNAILDDAIELYRGTEGMVITDRTPLDMLAYTAADIRRNNLSKLDEVEFVKYSARCFEVMNNYFSMFVLVQPGIVLVEAEGKAPASVAYIEHLNSLIMGLMVDERVTPPHFYIPRRMTDMDDRIACMEFAMGRTMKRWDDMKSGEYAH